MKRIAVVGLAFGIGAVVALTCWRTGRPALPPGTADALRSNDASGQASSDLSGDPAAPQPASPPVERSPRPSAVPMVRIPAHLIPPVSVERAQMLVSNMTEVALNRNALTQAE